MKLLVDTQLLIWAMTLNRKLPDEAQAAIESPDNECFFSAVSVWEVALKRRNHPELLPMTAGQLRTFCQKAGFKPLPVTCSHAECSDALPPVHGDPFDRMLVAQARQENMILLTHDSKLGAYGDWVWQV